MALSNPADLGACGTASALTPQGLQGFSSAALHINIGEGILFVKRKGKQALVNGGHSGIGPATARLFIPRARRFWPPAIHPTFTVPKSQLMVVVLTPSWESPPGEVSPRGFRYGK